MSKKFFHPAFTGVPWLSISCPSHLFLSLLPNKPILPTDFRRATLEFTTIITPVHINISIPTLPCINHYTFYTTDAWYLHHSDTSSTFFQGHIKQPMEITPLRIVPPLKQRYFSFYFSSHHQWKLKYSAQSSILVQYFQLPHTSNISCPPHPNYKQTIPFPKKSYKCPFYWQPSPWNVHP